MALTGCSLVFILVSEHNPNEQSLLLVSENNSNEHINTLCAKFHFHAHALHFAHTEHAQIERHAVY